MYGDDFVARAADRLGRLDADLMATLTEFSARTIAMAVRDLARVEPPIDEIVAAGGGVKNLSFTNIVATITLAQTIDGLRLRRRSDCHDSPSFP
jgi:1,6-anhydro-N-acetylmuramate kinase